MHTEDIMSAADGTAAARKTDYTNPGQQRVLALLVLLAGNEFTGLTPAQCAAALRTSQSNITRDLDNLATAGLAERVGESSGWRLTPKLVQIGLAFTTHLDRTKAAAAEIEQRYTRLPG